MLPAPKINISPAVSRISGSGAELTTVIADIFTDRGALLAASRLQQCTPQGEAAVPARRNGPTHGVEEVTAPLAGAQLLGQGKEQSTDEVVSAPRRVSPRAAPVA